MAEQAADKPTSDVLQQRESATSSEVPSHIAMVEAVNASVAQYGSGYLDAMYAALNEVSGIARPNDERIRHLLTQPKNAVDAAERCQEIIDGMQGSDNARREALRMLQERYS